MINKDGHIDRYIFRNQFRHEAVGEQVVNILEENIVKLDGIDKTLMLANMSILEPSAVQEFESLLEFDAPDQIFPRHVLSFMIMNLMNITDEQCESNPVLLQDPAQLYRFPIIEGYSFGSYVQNIKKLAKLFNTESKLVGALDSVIGWQIYGMQQVKTSNEQGKISYSLKNALDYRTGTLGAYFRTTANISILGNNKKKKFVLDLMETQRMDDDADIFEDLHTQCNPFLAALAEHNLLHLLVHDYQSYSGVIENDEIPGDLLKIMKAQEQNIRKSYLKY